MGKITGNVVYAGTSNYGDLNWDGKITATDSLLVSKHVSGTRVLGGENLTRAEVSGDGIINQTDVDLVLQMAVGSITKFPIEETIQCIDSDGGKNYFVFGSAMGRSVSGGVHTLQDECITSPVATNVLVREAYCDGEFAKSEDHECSNGCVGGACVETLSGEEEEENVLGDVNLDGNVTAVDALMVLNYLVGKVNLNTIQLSNADVNLGAGVTVVDVALILKAAVGSVELPFEGALIIEGSVPAGVASSYGDVDLDGDITASDALLALKYSTGQIEISDIKKLNADVDVDKKITEIDVDLILRRAVGQNINFPYGSSTSNGSDGGAPNRGIFGRILKGFRSIRG